MTDKEQIIIDGIDISKCRYHRRCVLPDNIGCKIDDFLCCDKPNCNFKQLARKTQIVEQQQKTLDELIGCVSLWEEFTEEESKLAKDSSIADLVVLLRKKTQEYEELKRQYESRKGLLNSVGKDNYRLMQECEELKEQLQANQPTGICETCTAKAILQNDKYRKALEEIEKFCNSVSAEENLYNSHHFSDGSMVVEVADSVLDIINKAKGRQ